MKNRVAAAVLALFLGGIGIHRFYLNRPISGFIYLIFVWTLIPSVLGFFEAISFFTYTDEDFNKKYGDADYRIKKEIEKAGKGSEDSSKAMSDLVSLSSLFEKKLISESEFNEKKKSLMARIG